MRTLYIRHVPDEVAARLEKLAAQAGLPLSTFAQCVMVAPRHLALHQPQQRFAHIREPHHQGGRLQR